MSKDFARAGTSGAGELPPISEIFRIAFVATPAALSNAMGTSTDVALILWNADLIDLMSFVLLERNITSDGIEPSQGTERIADFIASRSPAVVVYDLEPPYDRSAVNFLSMLDRFSGCSFVITCADRALALHSAPWLSGVPVFQKPYPLDEIADSVSSRVMRISQKLAAV